MEPARHAVCDADHSKYRGAIISKSVKRPGTELGCADPEVRWTPGSVLKVHFMDGSSSLRQNVQRYASQWTECADIRFDWSETNVAQSSEIRISFSFHPGKSWSYIGNVARTIPVDQPTMNLGWLTDDTDQQEISRVVLHEFGHALGLVHEHQHPEAKIPFKAAATIAALMGWTEEEVQVNIIDQYSPRRTQFSRFDLKSIMIYAYPSSWTTDGSSMQENAALSPTDKEFIRGFYSS